MQNLKDIIQKLKSLAVDNCLEFELCSEMSNENEITFKFIGDIPIQCKFCKAEMILARKVVEGNEIIKEYACPCGGYAKIKKYEQWWRKGG